jgi:endonuclease/exonuclease/phosphatase family metal-dependent hydrolase
LHVPPRDPARPWLDKIAMMGVMCAQTVRPLALSLLSTAMLAIAATPPAAQPTGGTELTVMSFNIRYGTAKDGENHWERRRDMLFDLLRSERADIIGMQEGLHFQIEEIIAAVPVYRSVGVARDDGAAKGEYSNIMYNRERFEVLDTGTFWFSDTPDVPGSTSWGNRITRICTWARFRPADGGQAFFVFNVHLDHESQPSRERSVVALAEAIVRRQPANDPVIVTGDLNADEQNRATRWLLGAEGLEGMPPRPAGLALVDTFRRLHPDATGVGTFTGFTFGHIGERKIDYVLVEPATTVHDARILHTSRDGRYPSDHFPVVARVTLRP